MDKIRKMFTFLHRLDFLILTNDVDYKRQRILRILVEYKNNNTDWGSGFFIDGQGQFLTCFHVVFGGELRNLRNNQDFKKISGADEKTRLNNWFLDRVRGIFVELADGSRIKMKIKNFEEKFDVALLVPEDQKNLPQFDFLVVNPKNKLRQDDQVFFGGFPIQFSYRAGESPFAVHSGIVSSFPKTEIGGDIYEHVQINSINLGGNSGAPLFRKNSNKVVGIVNGNMNWGNDNVAFVVNGSVTKDSFRIPLSIAYCTEFKTLKENTSIFG